MSYSKEVRKMLEEIDDIAVKAIDDDIARFQDLVETTKNKTTKYRYINKVERLLKLRKQVLWGV